MARQSMKWRLPRGSRKPCAMSWHNRPHAGIDIVNDGEQSKPSYATYIKDRLNGFGGAGTSYVFQDLEDYPGTKLATMGDEGRTHRRAPACNGPDQRQGHGRCPSRCREPAMDALMAGIPGVRRS